MGMARDDDAWFNNFVDYYYDNKKPWVGYENFLIILQYKSIQAYKKDIQNA